MILIAKRKFSIHKHVSEVSKKNSCIGAIVTFQGYVRDFYNSDDKLRYIFLEYYEEMTQKYLLNLEISAKKKWDLLDIKLIHRVGVIYVADPIVLIIVASAHRDVSFEACRYIIDHLKVKAPFWKKEVSEKKTSWVEQKQSDLVKVK